MQTSTTLLKKPLYLWLARILTLGVILASIGIGVSQLPRILDKLKHEGVTDINYSVYPNGEAIISDVTSTAEQNGVAIGDKVLNYEDDRGKLGTPVTFHIQRGSSPARDITVIRNLPASYEVYGGIQLGLPFDASVLLAFLLILGPLVVGAVGALLLYFLRSNDWMALFTAIVLANLGTAAGGEFSSSNPVILIFNRLMLFLTFFWILVFPNGKLMPRWSWAVSLLLLPSFILQSAIDLELLNGVGRDDFTSLTYMGMLALFSILYFRYRDTFSPAERQQTKWVIIPVIAGLMITGLIYSTSRYAQTYEQFAIRNFFNSFVRTVFFVSLAVGIFFSILRYRLWDVNTFISRAIVYGGLTGILGLVGFAVVPLINYALTQALGNQSGMLAVLVAAFPIAALYNPVHERMQQWVETRFKPEEMDFENTFIEFSYELRSMFTIEELSTLLARHAVEQLDVAYASVFLNGKNGQMQHIKTIRSDQDTSEPSLDEKTMEKISKSQLASPDGDYAQSLVIPLVVPRSRKPTILGALFLGPRLQGMGYSTALVKSLKKFGEDVGKAFYAAEIQDNKAQMLMEKE